MDMTEQYKKWANLDIKDIEPMEVTEIEIARMKKTVINKQEQTSKVKKRKWRNIIVASLFLLGVIITTNTTSIATNIKGYFEDITKWNGTVVDTQYTAGIADVTLSAGMINESKNGLLVPLTMTLNNINVEPFASIEALGIREALLIDNSNNEIGKLDIQEESGLRNNIPFELEEQDKLLSEMNLANNSSRAFKVNLLVDDKIILKEQQYKIKIQALYIYKTADAPLKVRGNWEIEVPFY